MYDLSTHFAEKPVTSGSVAMTIAPDLYAVARYPRAARWSRIHMRFSRKRPDGLKPLQVTIDLPSICDRSRAQGFPFVSVSLLGIHCGQGEEGNAVALIQPGVCEGFDQYTGSAGEVKGLDGQLGHYVHRFGSPGLVVQKVKKAGTKPQEVNVADDGLIPKRGGSVGATLSWGCVSPRKD